MSNSAKVMDKDNVRRALMRIAHEILEKNNNVILITHHVPSNSLTDEKYKAPFLLPYNQWFCSDMDNFIENNKDNLKCWVYGHTHTPSVKYINDGTGRPSK